MVSFSIPKNFNLLTSNWKFSIYILSFTLLKKPNAFEELSWLFSWDRLTVLKITQNNKIKYLILCNKVIDLKQLLH